MTSPFIFSHCVEEKFTNPTRQRGILADLLADASGYIFASLKKRNALRSMIAPAAIQRLEDRLYLAADFAALQMPTEVDLTIEFQNSIGEPIAQAALGDTFRIALFAQDLRTDAGESGVRSAYADILYDTQLADITTVSHALDQLLLGSIEDPFGLVDEAGGVAANAPDGRDRQLVVTLEAVASAEGSLQVVTEPADSAFAENTLFGVDGDLRGATNYGAATLKIVAPAAPTLSILSTTRIGNEADAATTAFQFEVRLSEPVGTPVVVSYATADGAARGMNIRQVASGLNTPLFAAAPDGDAERLFIVEKGGAIKILDLPSGQVQTQLFLAISGVNNSGEQGLLGLAFDPNYRQNGYFYVNYNPIVSPGQPGPTRISRFRAVGDPSTATAADPASETVLLTINQPFSNHNGGWIGFGPDGYLYIAAGDGGSGNDPQQHGQNLNSLLGTILRIDPSHDGAPGNPDINYAIPADNPFANDGDANTRAEIWAYGLRNPWRPSFDRLTGDLYIADVGQNRREEINFQPAASLGGENYGWRAREGTIATPSVGGAKPAGAIDPIYDYEHGQQANQGNSVTGGYAYRGPIDDLAGTYFFADFSNHRIWSLHHDGSAAAAHDGTNFSQFLDWTDRLAPGAASINSITSFAEDASGNLYVISGGGQIYRIENGADFGHTAGQLTFLPNGPLVQSVSVEVFGDARLEADEPFFLELSEAFGAAIAGGRASVVIANDDAAPATLFVTDVAASARGVEVALSRPLNPSELNLFTGPVQSGPPVDLQLRTDKGESIRGSLIVAPANDQLVFVPTVGRLAAGNYELILDSRSDAFAASADDLLDGNRDGIDGDHFSTRFTIDAAPERVLSLPHFSRAPGQQVRLFGGNGIPVQLNDAEGVTGFDFELVFDPALLQITEAELAASIPLDWSITVDTATPGVVRVSADGSALPSGTQEMVSLRADVPAAAAYGATQLLRLSELRMRGTGSLPVAADAAHVVALPGDATGNSEYSGQDAALIARNAVGLDDGFAFFPLTDPLLVADVSKNGAISALDAALVARAAVGLPEPGIPELPTAASFPFAMQRSAASTNAVSRSPSQLIAVIDALALARLHGDLEGDDESARIQSNL